MLVYKYTFIKYKDKWSLELSLKSCSSGSDRSTFHSTGSRFCHAGHPNRASPLTSEVVQYRMYKEAKGRRKNKLSTYSYKGVRSRGRGSLTDWWISSVLLILLHSWFIPLTVYAKHSSLVLTWRKNLETFVTYPLKNLQNSCWYIGTALTADSRSSYIWRNNDSLLCLPKRRRLEKLCVFSIERETHLKFNFAHFVLVTIIVGMSNT